MKGIPLSDLTKHSLTRVSKHHAKKPALTIQNPQEKLVQGVRTNYNAFAAWGEDEFNFFEHYHLLSQDALSGFTFDDLCKLKFSSSIMMDASVRTLFETEPSHEVVQKIQSSLWRLSMFGEDWNQIVAAYEAIPQFHLNELGPDFDLRLDFTTGYNERGYSKFSRTFLDGVFAYLLYYRGEHVMTIGFSFLKGNQVVITQIQQVKRRGNRFLFAFPSSRSEFIIRRFNEVFLQHQLGVVDGDSLVDRIMRDYSFGLEEAQRWVAHYESWANDAHNEETRNSNLRLAAYKREECQELKTRINHLRADRPRIVSFYGSYGACNSTRFVDAGGMKFRLVA